MSTQPQADHEALTNEHSRFVDDVGDRLIRLQDAAYDIGRERGKADMDAELRRLHAENAELVEALSDLLAEGEFTDYPGTRQADAVKAARAALSKHKE